MTNFKTALLIGTMLASGISAAPAFGQAAESAFTNSTRYDAMGRIVGTLAPDPDGAGPLKFGAVRNTYDVAGRLTKVEKGELASWKNESVAPSAWGAAFTVLQTIDTTYDVADRKVKETLSGGGSVQTVTQFSYDPVGRLQCTAVRMNSAAFASLPASACTGGAVGADGPDRITKNVYDNAGQLLQVREGVGTSVEAAEATYSYTANGKREFIVDGEGGRAKLVYDGHDRQSHWYFPSATKASAYDSSTQISALATANSLNSADFEQYSYDNNGNRTSLRKRDGLTITFSFDANDRVVTKDLPGTAADVGYTYDAHGLQLTAKFTASGEGLTNAYDGFGQLISAVSNVGGTSRALGFVYDADGNRTRITHPDSNFFTYAFDGLNRPNELLEESATNLVTIGYDQLGRRSSLGRPGAGSTSYSYDNASRLASLAHDLTGTAADLTLAFAYNPASQIKTRTGSNDSYAWTEPRLAAATSVNGLNEIITSSGVAFNSDLNGNLTNDGLTTFGYDTENRLKTATGAKTASLVYDPMGRLADIASGGTSTKLLYDGDDLIGEYNSAGILLRRYVHGPGADEPLIQYEGAGLTTKRHLHADHQGSVIAITDAAGASIATNRYDEYGVPQSTNSGRFGYTGQQWLPELGLYHYKARAYAQHLGRFMQVDQVGYDDQLNLYVYVGGDPVNSTDPDGQEGVMQWVSDSAKIVAHDLADLGNAIGKGDFQYAFGGMPPTLSGGANLVAAPLRAVSALRISASIRAAGKIESKAASLAAQAGRNSVTVRTPGGFNRVDLAGKSHYSKELGRDVSTPHVLSYRENTVNGVVRSVSAVGDPVPATMKDLNAVEATLKALSK